MKKGVYLICAFIVLMTPLMVGQASCQLMVPGVSDGDSFRYKLTAFWFSNDPNATCPTGLIEYNQTEWVTVTITNAGTEVHFAQTSHYYNGSETSDYGYVNLETGQYGGGLSIPIVGANISQGDEIYPLYSSGTSPTINETVMRSYEGVQRETNRYHVNDTNRMGMVYEYLDIYLDKITGIMVKIHDELSLLSSPNDLTIMEMEILDSNVWVVPEYQSPLIWFFLSPVVIVAFLLLKTRRNRLRNFSYSATPTV